MKNELKKYRNIFENELFSILNYWLEYSREPNGDGFYGAVDLENKPVSSANKSCVLNSRILWTFSAAGKSYPDSKYQEMAELAYNTLEKHFHDADNEGYYMEISSSNKVVNNIKHTYSQAFVLYSMCMYYELTGSDEVLNRIKEFFRFIDGITKDPNNPGYFEAFTHDWKLYEENRMADNNEPKSMNTHLHLLEAYSAVYSAWKDDEVKQRLSELLNIFNNNIIRESGHLGIFFDSGFTETQSSRGICSFGHDIEASWLILEAAETLGDERIKEEIQKKIEKMADAVLKSGVDKDGGLFLESTRFGSHVRTNKHWWLQAENLVGFMNMYQLSKEPVYWETVKLAWSFIDKHVIDHKGGEWFTKVNRMGVPYLLEPEDDPSPFYRNDWKIDPWKCPYHNGRAMMELCKRIDTLI